MWSQLSILAPSSCSSLYLLFLWFFHKALSCSVLTNSPPTILHRGLCPRCWSSFIPPASNPPVHQANPSCQPPISHSYRDLTQGQFTFHASLFFPCTPNLSEWYCLHLQQEKPCRLSFLLAFPRVKKQAKSPTPPKSYSLLSPGNLQNSSFIVFLHPESPPSEYLILRMLPQRVVCTNYTYAHVRFCLKSCSSWRIIWRVNPRVVEEQSKNFLIHSLPIPACPHFFPSPSYSALTKLSTATQFFHTSSPSWALFIVGSVSTAQPDREQ